MLDDPIVLSRIQFAFTVSFHIIFPAFTIGLSMWLAVIEGLWLKTKNTIYQDMFHFWLKIFAIAFGIGVVTGVVMAYQFGTNWSVLSHRVGNVLGPLLGFEVMTAFFLEASFLGIMLFGWKRVSPRLHFASTILVALGTMMSATWILAANSWMQTPAGFTLDPATGIFSPRDWLEIILNPSFPYRLAHMLLAAYISTSLVVCGVSAFYLLKDRHTIIAKRMLSLALGVICILVPIQLFMGDMHGLNTKEYQPAKVAAMEGIWETEKGAALRLFGMPDVKTETNAFEIKIPHLSSLILTHTWDGEIKGLKAFPREERPQNIATIFWCFRAMVGIGLLMLLVAVSGAILHYRQKLFTTRWFLRYCTCMIPSGFIAVLSGWFVTELGRQPYVVYHFLKTVDAHSPLTSQQALTSLSIFFIVYCFVFCTGIYYIIKLIRKGPVPYDDGPPSDFYGAHNHPLKKKPVRN